jgi:hypothetical protein
VCSNFPLQVGCCEKLLCIVQMSDQWQFLVVHLESIEYLLSWCTICGKIATLLFHMAHPQFKGKLLN